MIQIVKSAGAVTSAVRIAIIQLKNTKMTAKNVNKKNMKKNSANLNYLFVVNKRKKKIQKKKNMMIVKSVKKRKR